MASILKLCCSRFSILFHLCYNIILQNQLFGGLHVDIKTSIRKKMLNKLKNIQDRNTIESQIHQILFDTSYWKKSHVVAATYSMKHEWDTIRIIEKGWEEGKKVVLPRCDRITNTMTFYQCDNFEQLENTFLDLYEPVQHSSQIISKASIDVMIVPGLAFTMDGDRIGYGGGYFDRYLKNYKNTKIALAADFQIVKEDIHEKHDIQVDCIITNSSVIQCKK